MGLVLAVNAEALEYGCRLKVNELDGRGTQIVKDAKRAGKSLPNSITIATSFSGQWSNQDGTSNSKVKGTIEGFYRPEDDGFFSIVPLPVFGIDLKRSRNVIYICAHADPDPAKTHFTAYMMRGFDLDREVTFGNMMGDMFAGPQLNIKPLSLSLFSFSEIKRKFLFWLQWFPLLEIGFQATDGLQRLIANALGDFTSLGVERITLTKDFFEIASGIDQDNPSEAKIIRKVRLKKPDDE